MMGIACNIDNMMGSARNIDNMMGNACNIDNMMGIFPPGMSSICAGLVYIQALVPQ